jgi:hypothetical protein
MNPPSPPPVQQDPTQLALDQQAQNDQIKALQGTAQSDTANLMARFGALASYAQAAKG